MVKLVLAIFPVERKDAWVMNLIFHFYGSNSIINKLKINKNVSHIILLTSSAWFSIFGVK